MGYLIAFDGIDASGKTTQTKILERKLKESGREFLYLKFPDYENDGSAAVRLYLNGNLGKNPNDVNAYAASSFFAVDRYISYMTKWKEFYKRKNSVILSDRYTTANAVHQLSKLPDSEWDKFLDWLYDYEFNKLKIPKPDLTVLFDMHPDVAVKLIEKRAQETGVKKDIHETNPEYLRKSYESGQYAAKYLGWEKIICYKRDGETGVLIPKSEEEISENLFKLIEFAEMRKAKVK
ncbi:MAG: deoxynucleoside kinase [Oscillospiraceae bacterium]|nr:deoxynucleoside kinase [Oscillospiraceae bacterium]